MSQSPVRTHLERRALCKKIMIYLESIHFFCLDPRWSPRTPTRSSWTPCSSSHTQRRCGTSRNYTSQTNKLIQRTSTLKQFLRNPVIWHFLKNIRIVFKVFEFSKKNSNIEILKKVYYDYFSFLNYRNLEKLFNVIYFMQEYYNCFQSFWVF